MNSSRKFEKLEIFNINKLRELELKFQNCQYNMVNNKMIQPQLDSNVV